LNAWNILAAIQAWCFDCKITREKLPPTCEKWQPSSQGKALDKRKRETEDARRCTAVTEEMLADTKVGICTLNQVDP
jgi:hypothetical protein